VVNFLGPIRTPLLFGPRESLRGHREIWKLPGMRHEADPASSCETGPVFARFIIAVVPGESCNDSLRGSSRTQGRRRILTLYAFVLFTQPLDPALF